MTKIKPAMTAEEWESLESMMDDRRVRVALLIFGCVIGVAGLLIVCVTLGWLPFVGIVLLMWSDNIGNNARMHRELRDRKHLTMILQRMLDRWPGDAACSKEKSTVATVQPGEEP